METAAARTSGAAVELRDQMAADSQAGVVATLDRFETAVAQMSQTASELGRRISDSRRTARERSTGRRA